MINVVYWQSEHYTQFAGFSISIYVDNDTKTQEGWKSVLTAIDTILSLDVLYNIIIHKD